MPLPRSVQHCQNGGAVQLKKIDGQSSNMSEVDMMNNKLSILQATAARDACYDAQPYHEAPAQEGNAYREYFEPAPYTHSYTSYRLAQSFTLLMVVAGGLATISIVRALR